jgi:hypothetical protein
MIMDILEKQIGNDCNERSLSERIKRLEAWKTKEDAKDFIEPIKINSNEKKIVFDWFVGQGGRLEKPVTKPINWHKVVEITPANSYVNIFQSYDSHGLGGDIFIGHYE